MDSDRPPLPAALTKAATPADFWAVADEKLVPLCRDRFADPIGGFHERLDVELKPLPLGRKRLMVQCRQMYVLSHAALLGDKSGEWAVRSGYDFLRTHYRDDRYGGWFFSVTPEGEPLDRKKDLYGHAFVLFALGYIHRAFALPGAIGLAHETLRIVKDKLRAPAGGFWESANESWAPDTGQLTQNPHLHLLEGLLSLFEATGDKTWLAEADGIITLAQKYLLDPKTGTLGEYYTPAWSPDPREGHIIEPGHHFEWSWLLRRYVGLGGRIPVTSMATQLFAMAMNTGFDPEYGGIHDQTDRSGKVVLSTRRIWPVTEGIKACIAAAEAGNRDACDHGRYLIARLFSDFLVANEGRWHETLTREGKPTTVELPGSTPYHIFQAAAEVKRTSVFEPDSTT